MGSTLAVAYQTAPLYQTAALIHRPTWRLLRAPDCSLSLEDCPEDCPFFESSAPQIHSLNLERSLQTVAFTGCRRRWTFS